MPNTSLSHHHLPALDGVRGIAILLVLLLHLGVMIPKTPAENFVFGIISAGWVGVDLFFVLSGALITGILLDSKSSPTYYKDFYIRRALRILPLYYLILVISFYFLPLTAHPKTGNFARVAGDEIWYWLFLTNFKMAAAGGPQHGIMDVTWSLAIEEQFYLLWPLLVKHLSKAQLARVSLALFGLACLTRIVLQELDVAPFAIYVLTPARIDGLCAGSLVAISLRSGSVDSKALEKLANHLILAGVVALGIVVTVSKGLPWDGRLVQSIGYSIIAIFFAGVILKVYLNSGATVNYIRGLRSRPLVTLGILSYSLYLIHLPLRAMIRDVVLKPMNFSQWWGGALVAQACFYMLAGLIILAAAWMTFNLYEKRFLGLRQRFAPRRIGS